jgi:hypothetical protein
MSTVGAELKVLTPASEHPNIVVKRNVIARMEAPFG